MGIVVNACMAARAHCCVHTWQYGDKGKWTSRRKVTKRVGGMALWAGGQYGAVAKSRHGCIQTWG